MSEPPSLVSVIVELGFSSRAELEEALARQLIYGGELPENLLELGLLDEASIVQALARFHGLPASEPPPFELDERSTRIALEHGERVLVRATDLDRVVVTTRARLSETSLETLSLALEAQVDQEIGLALRVEEALEPLTGEPLIGRFSRLLDELGRRPPRVVRPPTPAEFRPPSQLFSPLPQKPEGRSPDSEVVATVPFRREEKAHEGITAPPPAGYEHITRSSERPSAAIEPLVAHTKSQLERATDRDFVLAELLDTVGHLFEYVALFAISAGEARGLRAVGAGVEGSELGALRIPLDLASPFERVVKSKNERVVRLRASGLEGGIAQDLRRPTGSRVLLFPLTLRDKAVLLLWADRGTLDVPPEGVELVRTLAPHVSLALGRVLVERKRASRIPTNAADVGALLPPVAAPPAARLPIPEAEGDAPAPEAPENATAPEAPAFEPHQDLTRRETPRRAQPSLPSEFGGKRNTSAEHSSAEAPPEETDAPEAPDASHLAEAPPADETTDGEAGDGAAPGRQRPRVNTARLTVAPEARQQAPLEHLEATADAPEPPSELLAGKPGSHEVAPNARRKLDEDPEFPSDAPRTWKGFPGSPPPPGVAPLPPLPHIDETPSDLRLTPRRIVAVGAPRPVAPEATSVAPKVSVTGTLSSAADAARVAAPEAGGATPEANPAAPKAGSAAPEVNVADTLSSNEPSLSEAAPTLQKKVTERSKAPLAPSEAAPPPRPRRAGEIAVVSSFANSTDAPARNEAPAIEAPPPPLASQAPEIRPGGTLVSRRPLLDEPPEDGWGAPAAPFGKRTSGARSYEALVDSWLSGDDDALELLVEGGDPAVASLIARFPGPVTEPESTQVPASACGPLLLALVRLGSRATPFLTVRTADENSDVRRWATLVLGEIPGRESAKAIAGRLLDSAAEVRRAALSSARRLQSDTLARRTLRSQIEEMAVDARLDAEARAAAIEALADIREHEAIPTLLQILSDKDRSIARAAQWALTVLTRQDFGNDFAAWRAFWQEHRDEPRIEWIIAALNHERSDLRRAAGDEILSLAGTDFGFHEALQEEERREIQDLVRAWWVSKKS